MNKEEIKHFKSLLRQGSLRHMNILLDNKFQKELQKTIIKDYKKLQQENEKLKKQYCERTDCGGRIGNSKKVEESEKQNKFLMERENKLQVIEMKQKEFIKYLEAEINKCQSNIFADGVKHGFQLSLSKYKEIIGGKE